MGWSIPPLGPHGRVNFKVSTRVIASQLLIGREPPGDVHWPRLSQFFAEAPGGKFGGFWSTVHAWPHLITGQLTKRESMGDNAHEASNCHAQIGE